MAKRATKRGDERTDLSGSLDVLICGASFAGLMAAILLMFINSMVETGFERLTESRRHVRETIARAKRELFLHVSPRPASTEKSAQGTSS